MIHVLICVTNFKWLGVVMIDEQITKHCYFKNDICHVCFRESAKCKMTTQQIKKYNVFVKIWTSHCDIRYTIKSSMFKLRPLFRWLCLVNLFYRRYVPPMYSIPNILNISPIHPTHSIHSVIKSYILPSFLSYVLCRISSSHRFREPTEVLEWKGF